LFKYNIFHVYQIFKNVNQTRNSESQSANVWMRLKNVLNFWKALMENINDECTMSKIITHEIVSIRNRYLDTSERKTPFKHF